MPCQPFRMFAALLLAVTAALFIGFPDGATPSALATGGDVGIDHDGSPPDINAGPATVNAGGTITVGLVVDAPSVGLGAWTIDVAFDPLVLDAISCNPTTPVGLAVCNAEFSAIEVRSAGATVSGLVGLVQLAEITFQAVGSELDCSALSPSVVTFADTTGTSLPSTVYQGEICVGVSCPSPANDDIASATVVGALPYFDSMDTSCATQDPADPDCFGSGPTVWYQFTATADGQMSANTFGSGYDTTLSVYTGAPGSLTQIACNDDSWPSLQSQVSFSAMAGTTYYIMVGSSGSGPGGWLEFRLDELVELGIEVDARGYVVAKDGLVTITGSLSCSEPVFVDLFTFVEQRAGRATIQGWGGQPLFCDGEEEWQISLTGFNGRFAAGWAEVSADAFVFDPVGGPVNEHADQLVRLRGMRP